MGQESIAARAAFIGERLVASLLSEPLDIRQNSSRRLSRTNLRESSEVILLPAYCQCMGQTWDNKVNLYAFRRLLAECGLERPPAAVDLLTRGASHISASILIDKEEIALELERFVSRWTDDYESLSKTVVSLCNAVATTLEYATLRAAEREISQHANTLRRKRAQLLLHDDYGTIDESRWRKEITYFVTRVILPAIEKDTIDEMLFAAIEDRVEQVAAEAGPESVSFSCETPAQFTPEEFEVYCARLLQGQGWEARLTKCSGDQGVDVVADRRGVTMVVQCKKYATPVGNGAVQEVHAGKGFYGADLGIVVSNAGFTSSARELANVLGILLMHHSELENFDKFLLDMLQRRAE